MLEAAKWWSPLGTYCIFHMLMLGVSGKGYRGLEGGSL